MSDNPYASPESDSDSSVDSAERQTYERLGGWLILVAIGVAFNPLALAAAVFFDNIPPLFNGTWEILTTPGAPGYHPLWRVLILYELLMHLTLFAWSTFAAFLFFCKHKALPRVIIGFLAAKFILTVITCLIASQIPTVREQLAGELGGQWTADLLKRAAACGIWIPYFRVSKRVQGTFVR